LRILNGAQFNIGWANNHMATVPCQMLFKSGGKNTKPWEELKKNDKLTRVYWGFTQLNGVVYYRMRGYADKMDSMGIESAYEDFKYDLKERQTKWQYELGNKFFTNDLEDLLKIADMSVFQIISSKLGVPFLLAAKEVVGKPIVTEVDDWLFDVPSYNLGSNPFNINSDMEWIAYEQLKLSDYLVVSTQYLKDHLLEFFPDKEIFVVPNSIDFAIYDDLKEDLTAYPKEPGKIRIGYSGCANHEGDLELIKRPLKKILEEHPNVELITPIMFNSFKDLPNVIYTRKWVPVNVFPIELKKWQMDIGLAPLRDNHFNRAKSNLRWLEYSGLKVPTIASDVYPFTNSITNGKNGILCEGSDLAWYEALKDLIASEEKRKAMGNEANKEVRLKFNMDVVAGYYAKLLKEIKWTEATLKPNAVGYSATPITTAGVPLPLGTE
jgi:glycosyltransferase involved in cell wall biosynthesis